MCHELITTLMRAFLETTNQAKKLTILIYCDFSFQIKLFLFKNTDIGWLHILIAIINMISFKHNLRYDTRHARIFIFMRDTRIKKIMIRDTRHATREFVFFMRDTIIKKIMIRDTRHECLFNYGAHCY